MRAQYVLKLFKELPVGTVFATTPSVHAHVWRKVSSRTARIGGHGNGAWFYFGSKERCYVERSVWHAMDCSGQFEIEEKDD